MALVMYQVPFQSDCVHVCVRGCMLKIQSYMPVMCPEKSLRSDSFNKRPMSNEQK